MTGETALEVLNVTKRFGGFTAVDDVSFTLAQGARHALIGPNGAGKTTLFNLLSGRLPMDAGDVRYRGRSIRGEPAHAICKLGIARTFQITSVYAQLTALQNVQTALFSRYGSSRWLLRPADKVRVEEARALLDLVGIGGLAGRVAGLLSYGDQKRLELAMVMGLEPGLLLLDEPTAGVEVNTRREIVTLIKDLCAKKGLTLLFCEHDMDAVFSIAETITVLHQGRILAQGSPLEIQENRQVREIYLGAGHGRAA